MLRGSLAPGEVDHREESKWNIWARASFPSRISTDRAPGDRDDRCRSDAPLSPEDDHLGTVGSYDPRIQTLLGHAGLQGDRCVAQVRGSLLSP